MYNDTRVTRDTGDTRHWRNTTLVTHDTPATHDKAVIAERR